MAPNRPQHNKQKTSKKLKRNILLAAIAIIILSNTPPVQFFLLESYSYRNGDRSFSYSEEAAKGMDLQAGLIQFEGWKKQNPINPNKTLYRTFSIKPWQFWQWWQYLAHHQRFLLPYRDP